VQFGNPSGTASRLRLRLRLRGDARHLNGDDSEDGKPSLQLQSVLTVPSLAGDCAERARGAGRWQRCPTDGNDAGCSQAPPQYAHISSTMLRERAAAGAAVDDLVPRGTAPWVLQLYG